MEQYRRPVGPTRQFHRIRDSESVRYCVSGDSVERCVRACDNPWEKACQKKRSSRIPLPSRHRSASEGPLDPHFRSHVGCDGETDSCCRMGVTRFSYAASKACPQYARDRWKLAPASHNVNATKRLYSPDLRDNRVDDVNRPINWRCASRVEVVNGNCGLV